MKSLLRTVLFALLLAGCTTGPALVPESYLASMAASEFQRLKQEMQVSQDPARTARVHEVGKRIAWAVKDDIPNAQWEFVLFENASVNAFAMPGGKIAVFTGLLDLIDSNDELAVVVGHEVAHVLFRHSNQRMTAELIRSFGGIIAAETTKDMDEDQRALILAAYGLGSQFGIMLPYSRAHEKQADREGLLISARAGYNPQAAISFWQKMDQASSSSPPEFLSTHPSYNTRIRTLQETMPQAMALYNP
jgi:predicted Zn-dependent protease